MSFADEVVKDGRGVVYKLDVSLDDFASISYRYSTHAGIDSANVYDPRIVGLGNLTRGLGLDHVMQTGSVDVALANEDEGVDWMLNADTALNTLRARCRLYIGLFDTDAADIPSNIQWKHLAEMVFGEFPRRQADRVIAILMDDTGGALKHPVVLPTLADWHTADPSDATNPLAGYFASSVMWASAQIDSARPIQLAFGSDHVLCQQVTLEKVQTGTYAGKIPFVVCCTASTEDVTANDVTSVMIGGVIFGGNKAESPPVELPQFYADKLNGQMVQVWEAHKSATITKDGIDFRVLWISIDTSGLASFLVDLAGWTGTVQNLALWASGFPLSSHSVGQSHQHPADVVRDLVWFYSKAGPSRVDIASLDRMKQNFPTWSACGTIGGDGEDAARSLTDHLSDIGDSFDVDVFVTWDGQVGMAAPNRDYGSQTAALLEIDETRVDGFEDFIPSREQRGAPYNRVVTRDGRYDPLMGREFRPWAENDPDNTQRSTAWGRVIEKSVSVRWQSQAEFRGLWFGRNLEARVRPRARFKTDLEALRLELGDYFRLNWTRNLGDPYVSTIFQLDAVMLSPDTNTVQVEALWADDLLSERPYLLDDETLLVRATGSALRTVYVEDGFDVLIFSSGDLTADGIESGDLLVLKDSTEAATSFKRFKSLRIIEVTSATQLVIEDPLDGLDFGAPSGAFVTAWEIVRSHVTYPIDGSDPVNYPDGANMYGRVANNSGTGVYSQAGAGGFTDAHKLLDG